MIAVELAVSKHIPVCPTNGRPGRSVGRITVQSMINNRDVDLRDAQFRLCFDPSCPTVYYSEDGLQLFGEQDLSERLYQKHNLDDDQLICYCFRYKTGDIRSQVLSKGKTEIPGTISKEISAGKCECEIRNPQGSCCLGNVHMLVNDIQVKDQSHDQ